MLSFIAILSAGTVDGLLGWEGPAAGIGPAQVQPAGDLNGDGLGDLAIGVPLDESSAKGAGAVYLLLDVVDSAGLPLQDIAIQRTGTQTEDNAGAAIAGGGDLDGDGYADLLVAAPQATTDTTNEGKVYLIYGQSNPSAGGLESDLIFAGGEDFDRIGTRVYIAPDLNDDGASEVLIGAPYLNPNGSAGLGWLALYYGRRFSGVEQLLVDSSTTTADAAWIHNRSATFFGLSAALLPQAEGWTLAIGAPGLDDNHGALYFFDPTVTETNHVYAPDQAFGALVTDHEIGLPWKLSAGSSQLWAGLPYGAEQAGEIYAITPSTNTTPLGSARWTGEGQLGWGLAAWEPGDGRLLVAGEPSWNDGTGRVQIFDENGVVERFEGCIVGGTVGSYVDAGPGPDPWGEDRPWVGFSGSGDANWGQGRGHAWILGTTDHGGSDCPESTVPAWDADHDGVPAPTDCDDQDDRRYLGATELCGDTLDNDCDEDVDESCGPALAETEAGGCGGGAAFLLLPLGLRRRRGVS